MKTEVITCVEILKPDKIVPIFDNIVNYSPLDFSPLVSFNPVDNTSQTYQVEISIVVIDKECDLGIKINDWKEEIEGIVARKITVTCSTPKPETNSANKKICILQFEYAVNHPSEQDKSIYVCLKYDDYNTTNPDRGTVTTTSDGVGDGSNLT